MIKLITSIAEIHTLSFLSFPFFPPLLLLPLFLLIFILITRHILIFTTLNQCCFFLKFYWGKKPSALQLLLPSSSSFLHPFSSSSPLSFLPFVSLLRVLLNYSFNLIQRKIRTSLIIFTFIIE